MRELQFRLFPRGFLGAQLSNRIQARQTGGSTEVQAVQNTFKILQTSDNQTLVGNPQVEELYQKNISGATETNTLEFKKNVLIVALNAFGTDYFDIWFRTQMKTPYFGDNHSAFLDDCLNFLQTGQRDLPLQTWQALVTHDDTGELRTELSLKAVCYFGITTPGYVREPRNNKLVDVIHQWVSHPGGLEDLLGTLHILFGDV